MRTTQRHAVVQNSAVNSDPGVEPAQGNDRTATGRYDRIRRAEPPGSPPELLVPLQGAAATVVNVVSFDSRGLTELKLTSLAQLDELESPDSVLWIDIDGLSNVELIAAVGKRFQLHTLTVEDILHVHQRAKVEVFDTYIFVVARMLAVQSGYKTEQLAMVVGPHWVLTFQEGIPGDPLEPVRHHLRSHVGLLRERGADYLSYSVLDAVVDGYFPFLEQQGDVLDELEQAIFEGHPPSDVLTQVYEVKRGLLTLRRAVLPLREALAHLQLEQTTLFALETRPYLRDVSDHAGQLLDHLDVFREMAAGLIDVHLSLQNHRINEVVRVLTVLGSIFLPLTVLTGIYGMNFDPDAGPWNMPELRWAFGYPALILAMLCITAGSLWYFRRRGWLTRQDW
jgi:magnesium transporter